MAAPLDDVKSKGKGGPYPYSAVTVSGNTRGLGRSLALWQLKLKSRLGEFWRVRGRGRGPGGPYFSLALLGLATFLVTIFLWRISDVDPRFCKGTASREAVAKEKYTIGKRLSSKVSGVHIADR